ncbi:hypothetical protein P691DRAFT_785191 [Macrolepiota fuliginosa MF-IS2]|uniref:Uncharacterized protein n=1 Tax=Macrolepiota fuliginosa MF-IS2 TaxID=1400762 RepID=A0A9P5XIM0_9AGAR|nr:hypothetical protein P691DRAFT_785191 [Macrolepiota fuliginosa MF-IS2]
MSEPLPTLNHEDLVSEKCVTNPHDTPVSSQEWRQARSRTFEALKVVLCSYAITYDASRSSLKLHRSSFIGFDDLVTVYATNNWLRCITIFDEYGPKAPRAEGVAIRRRCCRGTGFSVHVSSARSFYINCLPACMSTAGRLMFIISSLRKLAWSIVTQDVDGVIKQRPSHAVKLLQILGKGSSLQSHVRYLAT